MQNTDKITQNKQQIIEISNHYGFSDIRLRKPSPLQNENSFNFIVKSPDDITLSDIYNYCDDLRVLLGSNEVYVETDSGLQQLFKKSSANKRLLEPLVREAVLLEQITDNKPAAKDWTYGNAASFFPARSEQTTAPASHLEGLLVSFSLYQQSHPTEPPEQCAKHFNKPQR